MMETLTYACPLVGSHSSQSTAIQTNLYDLIEAIAVEVRPNEEALVTAIAAHLLRSHKVKFIGKRGRGHACGERTNYLNSASA
jgi:hypothetical protein